MHDTVHLADRHSRPKRVVLGLIGLAVMIWPIWDLWRGIASLSILSPVFWIIGLGAIALGLILIGGAVLGWSTVLTLTPEHVMLAEENLLRSRVTRLDPTTLGPVRVERHDWSEGPATWRVHVERMNSKPLLSQDFPDRTSAEALALRITSALAAATR